LSWAAVVQSVIREAFTWVAVLGGLAWAVLNFDQIRAVNAWLTGVPVEQVTSDTGASAKHIKTEGSGFAGLFAREQPKPARRAANGMSVELASDNRGHYQASAEINGRDISALVDTGASMVVLTYEDAERAGIYLKPSDFTASSRTANGTARNAPITLDEVCVESLCVRDVRAAVAEPGRLHVSLLGMTYLGRLGRFEMRSGTLVLEE